MVIMRTLKILRFVCKGILPHPFLSAFYFENEENTRGCGNAPLQTKRNISNVVISNTNTQTIVVIYFR